MLWTNLVTAAGLTSRSRTRQASTSRTCSIGNLADQPTAARRLTVRLDSIKRPILQSNTSCSSEMDSDLAYVLALWSGATDGLSTCNNNRINDSPVIQRLGLH